MARVNDNLFTKLIEYTVPKEMDFRLLTRLGPVKARFTPQGLSGLYFEDASVQPIETDSVFRDVFLSWLAHYQVQCPEEQWTYLAPAGTDFQQSVWRALLEVNAGDTTSYSEIARSITQPNAQRAVGSAIGANPIALLVPCHRIVRRDGSVGQYRWGSDRKQALLDAEQKAGTQLVDLFQ